MIILFKALVICLVIYSLALVFLYIYQSRMVFRPGAENPFTRDYSPFVSLVYQTPAGMNMRGMWHPPHATPHGNRPVIVFFQGNKGHIGHRLDKMKQFLAQGYGVAMVGYRGYSGNPGYPNEKNLMDDGRAVIHLLGKKGYPPSSLVLYGESLGSGIAVRMAYENPDIKAVILEAPFTSIADVAEKHYRFFPVKKLLQNRFDSYKIIPALKMPVLVFHGTHDMTTPIEIGHNLFSYVTSPNKQFVSVKEAGHTNLYDHGAMEIINEFLAKTL